MGWGAVVAGVLAVVLGIVASCVQGCAHMTPAQEQAAVAAADLGACQVSELVGCLPVAGGWDAYKRCIAAEELACLRARGPAAGVAALDLFFESTGMRLAAAYVQPPDAALAAAAACMEGIDAELVAAQCPPGKAPRLCVAAAVQWCADHGAESGLGETEPAAP